MASPHISQWVPPERGVILKIRCLGKNGSFKVESGPGKKTLQIKMGQRILGVRPLSPQGSLQRMGGTCQPLEGAWPKEAWWVLYRCPISVPIVFP